MCGNLLQRFGADEGQGATLLDAGEDDGRKIVWRGVGDDARDDIRAAARDALIKKAKEAADKVRKWGDIVELEPMNAYDRRVVHQALRDDPDIETQSVEVEGTDKKAMLLRPKRKE